MIDILCPGCGEKLQISQDDIELYGQLDCPECGTVLEITNLDPIQVSLIDIDVFDDDDELDDDDL